jgi:phage shock protein A
MGIFSRLGSLIKSNLNDLISQAEDPEKMLNQVLLDMQSSLVEAKKQVAVAIADEKRLQKQLETEQEKGKEWERKAMIAVRANDDTLAREALARKQEHDNIGAQYQQQWLAQKAAVDKLKDALRLLNNKIEEAKRKKNILVARKKRAEAQKTIATTMSGLSDTSAFDSFYRMSAKIVQL